MAPMKKTTTPKTLAKTEVKKEQVVAPSASTLDFIRVFARVYDPKETLSRSLMEICVN